MIATCTTKHQPTKPATPGLNLEEFEEAIAAWKGRLQGGLNKSIRANDETLGHWEERVLRETRAVQRQVVEKAAQAKADGVPPICPYCGGQLTRVTEGHARTFESRFGPSPSGAPEDPVTNATSGAFLPMRSWVWKTRAALRPVCRRWRPWA